MQAQRKTPGVYVTELSAFPPSVVGVQTAIPAFIGYTEMATQSAQSVLLKPVVINSLADYEEVFGGAPPRNFDLAAVTAPSGAPAAGAPPPAPVDVMIGGSPFSLTQDKAQHKFFLYDSLRLFYANGGGTCYIVSVGLYKDKNLDSDALIKGLSAIEDQIGPTMLVVPDASLLPPDSATAPFVCAAFNTVTTTMLRQCGKLADRVAVIDVYGGGAITQRSDLALAVDAFRAGVGTESLSYGMAYFPFLKTAVVQPNDMSLASFDLADTATVTALTTALTAEAKLVYPDAAKAATLTASIAAVLTGTLPPPQPPAPADGAPATPEWTKWTKWVALNKDLPAALPVLKQIYGILADKLNVLPPSGAMAGVYTYVDSTRGVWNAPANISLSAVAGPAFKITAATQEDLNVPIEGKAINAIRDFVGRGTLVWGARTLDGNSNDWRYIQVRRTLVYIEQSIKVALNQFVFAANDGQTWVTVTAMISNFLQGLWSQGGLLGAKASEAFTVQCGLGSTMTGLDVLNGYMRVQVTLQMIHPAEFIELTFKQQMQGV